MRRRDFILAAATLLPVVRRATAQKSVQTKRIALASTGRAATGGPLIDELARLGYVEGKNLIIDRYSAEGQRDRYGDIARQVVSSHPDVIVCNGNALTRELKTATNTIPIVAFVGDPVLAGFASSLAHPGGNITGISVDAGIEIEGKRVALLVEAVPKIRHVAFIASPEVWKSPRGQSMQEVARGLGISVTNAPFGSNTDEAEYRRVFSSIQGDQVDGIAFSQEPENAAHGLLAVQLAEQARIPAIYVYRFQTEAGGLMSYSYDLNGLILTNAKQAAAILNGANPGEIPFEQASRFELVVNLKTAKALGLEISPTFMARADAVIE